MFTPRLPSHLMFRAIAIRRLQERKAKNAAILAEDVRLTWLYMCSQDERDLSLLNNTVYSSRICAHVGTPLPITFETRSAFARTFR